MKISNETKRVKENNATSIFWMRLYPEHERIVKEATKQFKNRQEFIRWLIEQTPKLLKIK